jgi:transcriptional regulator with XRE-family HTH domain
MKEKIQMLVYTQGVSQAHIARSSGVSSRTISKIVNSDYMPGARITAKIETYLNSLTWE